MAKEMFKYNKKTIGIVYDVVKNICPSKQFNLPHDAQSEWESQETIDSICETWKNLNYNVVLFPIDKNFLTYWAQSSSRCDVIHSLVEGFGSLARESWIAGLCELNGIPCIGSNPFVHSICMSKHQVKLICHLLNIPTAQSYLINTQNDFHKIPESFLQSAHFIKPNGEGSGMGVDKNHSVSSSKAQAAIVVNQLLNLYPDGVLLETYLPGAEYTTGIVGLDEMFLPIAEIEVPDGVYGAANKSKDYLSEKVTFPQLPTQIFDQLKLNSEKLFNYFKMQDMVRFDWKCDKNGNPYFLEANTLPGLSKIYSTLPLMAKEAGFEYAQFMNLLFESAYARKNHRSLWYGQTRVQDLNGNAHLNV